MVAFSPGGHLLSFRCLLRAMPGAAVGADAEAHWEDFLSLSIAPDGMRWDQEEGAESSRTSGQSWHLAPGPQLPASCCRHRRWLSLRCRRLPCYGATRGGDDGRVGWP